MYISPSLSLYIYVNGREQIHGPRRATIIEALCRNTQPLAQSYDLLDLACLTPEAENWTDMNCSL